MPELTCALGPDSAGSVLTGLVRGAGASLEGAIYEVGPSYAWAFAAAARRGVRVRLLLDGHPWDGNAVTASRLRAAGSECRVLRSGVAAGHWKVLRVDGRRTAVGTGNLVWRDAPRAAREHVPPQAPVLRGTREWWALTDDSDVAGAALEAIEVAWDRSRRPPRSWSAWSSRPHAARPAPGRVGAPLPQVPPLRLSLEQGCVRLVVGGLAVAATLRRCVDRAASRVLLTVPYVRMRTMAVRALTGAARDARERGADVRLLLGAPPDPGDAARLLRTGIAARWMDPDAGTRGHAKGVIADGEAAITSANWSSAGLGANWEAALIVSSGAAADYLASAFERDWALARAVTIAV